MKAETILQRARELGITLSLAGDRIRYAPKSATPQHFVELLRTHKADLMEYLRAQGGRLQQPVDSPQCPRTSLGVHRDPVLGEELPRPFTRQRCCYLPKGQLRQIKWVIKTIAEVPHFS